MCLCTSLDCAMVMKWNPDFVSQYLFSTNRFQVLTGWKQKSHVAMVRHQNKTHCVPSSTILYLCSLWSLYYLLHTKVLQKHSKHLYVDLLSCVKLCISCKTIEVVKWIQTSEWSYAVLCCEDEIFKMICHGHRCCISHTNNLEPSLLWTCTGFAFS